MEIKIRPMTMKDYDEVYALWMTIKGFGIRSIDDSREGTARFLKRNPTTSIVAEADGKLVGAILCGHDGRTGCFYHVCVNEAYRNHGIGKQMATAAMRALQREQINKVNLIAFKKNELGNHFWQDEGWKMRDDVNWEKSRFPICHSASITSKSRPRCTGDTIKICRLLFFYFNSFFVLISMHICCYILKAFFKIFLIFRPAIGKSFVILMKNCIIWIYFIPYA